LDGRQHLGIRSPSRQYLGRLQNFASRFGQIGKGGTRLWHFDNLLVHRRLDAPVGTKVWHAGTAISLGLSDCAPLFCLCHDYNLLEIMVVGGWNAVKYSNTVYA
jgi:hypothetical protein